MRTKLAIAFALLLPLLAACGSSAAHHPAAAAVTHTATPAPADPDPGTVAAAAECSRFTTASGVITAGTADDQTVGELVATLGVSSRAWVKQLDAAQKPAKGLPQGSSRPNLLAVDIARNGYLLSFTELEAATGGMDHVKHDWAKFLRSMTRTATACAG